MPAKEKGTQQLFPVPFSLGGFKSLNKNDTGAEPILQAGSFPSWGTTAAPSSTSNQAGALGMCHFVVAPPAQPCSVTLLGVGVIPQPVKLSSPAQSSSPREAILRQIPPLRTGIRKQAWGQLSKERGLLHKPDSLSSSPGTLLRRGMRWLESVIPALLRQDNHQDTCRPASLEDTVWQTRDALPRNNMDGDN